MASTGNTALQQGIPYIQDAFVVIIKTEWNSNIVDKLEEGAIKILQSQKVDYKTITVPGAVEILFAVKAYAASSLQKADAFITLGAVIQGGTPHFEYVCNMVTNGVAQLNLTLQAPVIFGVLTLNNEQQALERIGGVHGHKGEEAAITAIKMITMQRLLKE